MASSVEPDIISVSIHTRKPRSRMLFATRSTVACKSHWYLPPHARPAAADPHARWATRKLHRFPRAAGPTHEIMRCPPSAARAAPADDGTAPRRSSIAASAPRQRAPTPMSSAARAWCRSKPMHPSWPSSARLPIGEKLRGAARRAREPTACNGRAAYPRGGTHLSWKSASLPCSCPRRTCERRDPCQTKARMPAAHSAPCQRGAAYHQRRPAPAAAVRGAARRAPAQHRRARVQHARVALGQDVWLVGIRHADARQGVQRRPAGSVGGKWVGYRHAWEQGVYDCGKRSARPGGLTDQI